MSEIPKSKKHQPFLVRYLSHVKWHKKGKFWGLVEYDYFDKLCWSDTGESVCGTCVELMGWVDIKEREIGYPK